MSGIAPQVSKNHHGIKRTQPALVESRGWGWGVRGSIYKVGVMYERLLSGLLLGGDGLSDEVSLVPLEEPKKREERTKVWGQHEDSSVMLDLPPNGCSPLSIEVLLLWTAQAASSLSAGARNPPSSASFSSLAPPFPNCVSTIPHSSSLSSYMKACRKRTGSRTSRSRWTPS
jgi:hypothetical protein